MPVQSKKRARPKESSHDQRSEPAPQRRKRAPASTSQPKQSTQPSSQKSTNPSARVTVSRAVKQKPLKPQHGRNSSTSSGEPTKSISNEAQENASPKKDESMNGTSAEEPSRPLAYPLADRTVFFDHFYDEVCELLTKEFTKKELTLKGDEGSRARRDATDVVKYRIRHIIDEILCKIVPTEYSQADRDCSYHDKIHALDVLRSISEALLQAKTALGRHVKRDYYNDARIPGAMFDILKSMGLEDWLKIKSEGELMSGLRRVRDQMGEGYTSDRFHRVVAFIQCQGTV